ERSTRQGNGQGATDPGGRLSEPLRHRGHDGRTRHRVFRCRRALATVAGKTGQGRPPQAL
ncbi:hypothetical protein, partial [Pseudomonas sp. FEN]